MVKELRPSFLLIAMVFLFSSGAFAQDCNPKDFTHQDVEQIRFSRFVRDAGYSVLDSEKKSEKGSSFDASTTVKGIPFSVSQRDARSIQERLYSASGYNFSDDIKSEYVRTALSVVGRDMYEMCVSRQNIKVIIPQSAYSEGAFFLNVKYEGQDSDDKVAKLEMRVINGVVEGQQSYTVDIEKKQTRNILISRSTDPAGSKQSLQVAISIGKFNYNTLIFPPLVKIVDYDLVERRGKGTPILCGTCGDVASIKSNKGAHCQGDEKICTMCVTKSKDGILLPSTARMNPMQSAGSEIKMRDDNNVLQVCGYFKTFGTNRFGDNNEVVGGTLTVFELIPRTTSN